MLLASGVVRAQTSSYVYDANGRVVAVTATNGTSVQYSYNTLGHTSQVSAPISAGQLAIFAFMPTHGVAGTQVIIQGQGFDSNASNDTVSFNGTVATVLSASPTRMIVSVPNGATTGPITVIVAGQTVTSVTPFVSDDTGAPPTIAQVNPLVVAAGATVTITGAHLGPVAGGTAVQMGGVDMLTGLSQTDTRVQYTVPNNAVSGHVTVTTPYGSATSAMPVAVLPSSVVSTVNGAPISYLPTNGSATGFSTEVAGKSGVLTFDAPKRGNDEFTLDGITITGSSTTQVNVNVYGPSGTSVASSVCYTSNPGATCRIGLWNLVPGTYTAVVSPVDASSIISFNAIVQPDTVGPSLAANTPTTVNLGVGQVERLTFSANVGDTYALQLSGVNTTPANQTMSVYVYSPTATTITASNSYTNFSTTSSSVINLSNLPASGTYTVLVFTTGFPGSGQLTLVPGATGTLPSSGTAQSYATAAAGQDAYLTFTATAGANLELTLDNLRVSAGTAVAVNVYNASGTNIGSVDCSTSYPGATERMGLWNLAAGTYSVVVSPVSGGTMSFNAMVQPDVVGPALTVGTPTTVNLGVGQVERLTFNANAGDTFALQLSDVSSTPANQAMAVYVYSPMTTTITASNAYTSFYTASSSAINLSNLPASGTYTVVVITSGIPGSGQLTLTPQ
ncbi:MAG TPA: pre-peptidase C-terminal domain-containing protein [Dyella sp.]|uniref:pre-peptidase C-terminal domain-containing protein n=1 Tax=Dyella sp. TaxID=1869338 RepID=UPI002D0FF036|nr:pre-peptidase C-terminal domain-containing protein [Dyella sp.]HUB90182.1 pre-peptidase C-terminal domain-containing protein [Dyella sp.]